MAGLLLVKLLQVFKILGAECWRVESSVSNARASGTDWDHGLCLVAQLCLTLCEPMDCSLPGSSVHDILQAKILEWAAMPSSRGSSQPRDQTHVSCIPGRFFTNWATREDSSGESLFRMLQTTTWPWSWSWSCTMECRRERCCSPIEPHPGPAAAACTTYAPGCHHAAPDLQHACCGGQRAAPGSHEVPHGHSSQPS